MTKEGGVDNSIRNVCDISESEVTRLFQTEKRRKQMSFCLKLVWYLKEEVFRGNVFPRSMYHPMHPQLTLKKSNRWQSRDRDSWREKMRMKDEKRSCHRTSLYSQRDTNREKWRLRPRSHREREVTRPRLSLYDMRYHFRHQTRETEKSTLFQTQTSISCDDKRVKFVTREIDSITLPLVLPFDSTKNHTFDDHYYLKHTELNTVALITSEEIKSVKHYVDEKREAWYEREQS